MWIDPQRPVLYVAIDRWVNAALKHDDSLFTPGQAIWTAANVDDLYRRCLEHEEQSKRNWITKLDGRLDGASRQVRQLMAELLYAHLLMPATASITVKRKLEMVRRVLPTIIIAADLSAALDDGLATIGAGTAQRYWQLAFLLRFMRDWKQLSNLEREQYLADPWAFRTFVHDTRRPKTRAGVPRDGAGVQVAALLHMAFPNTFEDELADSERNAIVNYFRALVPDTVPAGDVDKQLSAIREKLTPQLYPGFRFYIPELKTLWGTWLRTRSSRFPMR